MTFIKLLPYNSVYDDDIMPVALWESLDNVCELQTDKKAGKCDDSQYYYGSDDVDDPKFCARHFYQLVVIGDSYQLDC